MKTVRVRIAVAVGPDGSWAAEGWRHSASGRSDTTLSKLHARNAMGRVHGGDDAHVVWVEADVPVPEEAVVEGEVSDR